MFACYTMELALSIGFKGGCRVSGVLCGVPGCCRGVFCSYLYQGEGADAAFERGYRVSHQSHHAR